MVGISIENGCKSFRARKDYSKNGECTDQKTFHLMPTWQDIDVLQSVHSAIKDLADFTDTLSGEDQVTLSTLKAVLYLLKNQVLVESHTILLPLSVVRHTWLSGSRPQVSRVSTITS